MDLADHFHRQCRFHALPCPRCKVPVLQSNIVNHRDAGCSPPQRIEKASTQKQVLRGQRHIAEALEKLSSDHNHIQATVNVALENVRTELSTLRESVSTETVKPNDRYGDATADILGLLSQLKSGLETRLTKEMNALSLRVFSAVESVANKVRCIHCFTMFHWQIDNWREFKDEAASTGSAVSESSSVYLHGYHVICVTKLVKRGHQLNVGCFLKFAEGDWDSMLEWPFRKTFKISIVHPRGASSVLSTYLDAREYQNEDAFQKPDGTFRSCFGPENISTAEALDRGGFVSNNAIHMCIEIEP